MSPKVVKGITEQYYHTIPDNLDRIITTPNKEAISKMLSQITYRQFPEFVLDILVKVFKHTKVDITDGQGDEQQDILTLDPQGQRCLTQCKHTENPSSHYNGVDLDNMVVVCFRKDCQKALFVTNGDITPQGKKYVTDKEYNRLLQKIAPEVNLEIDYLNDLKLWELVKSNSDILNKWFSGMGQTTALRSFRFNAFVQVLPYKDERYPEVPFNELITTMVSRGKLKPKTEKAESFIGTLPSGIYIKVTNWVQHTSEIDVNYILPLKGNDSPYRVMDALSIEVTIPEMKYQPEDVRTEVVQYLFSVLPELEDKYKNWWHITASAPRSFIFLLDIGKPREVTLCAAKTYIKIGELDVTGEFEHCTLDGDEFVSKFPDEDNAMWTHVSGLDVYQMFDQKQPPVQLYHQQQLFLKSLQSYQSYIFFGAKNVETVLSNRIRGLLPEDWIAITNSSDILWGIPPSTRQDKIDHVHRKLSAIYVKALEVDDSTKKYLLDNLSRDMPQALFYYISDIDDLSYPVNLLERVVCIIADVPIDVITIEKAMELLKYKYSLENLNGFTHMEGMEKMHSHSSELPSLLADIHTIRGHVMLDIGVNSSPLKIFIRFRRPTLNGGKEMVIKFLEEAKVILEDIRLLATGRTINETIYLSQEN